MNHNPWKERRADLSKDPQWQNNAVGLQLLDKFPFPSQGRVLVTIITVQTDQ